MALVIAVLLGASAYSGMGPLVVAALVVPMLMLAIGWVPLLRLPSPRGTTVVQLIGVVVLLVPTLIHPEGTLSWLPGAVAVAMIASFVHQLVRRDARPRLVESVSASAAGVALLSSAVCLVPLAASEHGRDAIIVVMAATAAATLPDIGLGREPRSLIAYGCAAASVVLGTVAALLTHLFLGEAPLPGAAVALAGAMAGAGSYALRQIQSVLPSLWGRRAQVASAAGSVLCTGAVAYGLDWFTVLGT